MNYTIQISTKVFVQVTKKMAVSQPCRSPIMEAEFPLCTATDNLCIRYEVSSLSPVCSDIHLLRIAVGLRLGVPICGPHTCRHCGAKVDNHGKTFAQL